MFTYNHHFYHKKIADLVHIALLHTYREVIPRTLKQLKLNVLEFLIPLMVKIHGSPNSLGLKIKWHTKNTLSCKLICRTCLGWNQSRSQFQHFWANVVVSAFEAMNLAHASSSSPSSNWNCSCCVCVCGGVCECVGRGEVHCYNPVTLSLSVLTWCEDVLPLRLPGLHQLPPLFCCRREQTWRQHYTIWPRVSVLTLWYNKHRFCTVPRPIPGNDI